MKLRFPIKDVRYCPAQWTDEELTVSGVTEAMFVAMFQRLAKPSQKRLYTKIKATIESDKQ